MLKNKHIPAFTLVEVLVSMAVTAIVIGIVFVIFSIMAERMADYRDQNEPISEMNRLSYALTRDFHEASQVEVLDDNILCSSYNSARSSYVFADFYIVRQQEAFRDTFRLAPLELKIDTLENASRRILLQRLTIRTSVNQNHTELRFYRKIYPNELVNQN